MTPHAALADAALERQTGVYIERSDPHDRYTYRLRETIYAGATPFQEVVIADTYNYGRALFLDGNIQSAEGDEVVYHEMLVQPSLLCHPEPRDVLIIGGGEGAVLREVLAHRSVGSVTMVDIDRTVVELCRAHLPTWHCGAFDDERSHLVFQDGRRFVENDRGMYDVAIIDVVDMLDNGPAQALYTRQFYERLRPRLRPGAIVAVQGMEFSFLDNQSHAALARTLRTVFPNVQSYRVGVPSYLGTWGFLLASDWLQLSQWGAEALDRRIQQRLGPPGLRHVTGEFIKGCLSLCKATRSRLLRPGQILEDGVPFHPLPYEGSSASPTGGRL